MRNTEVITKHYLIAALWSSTDEHGEPLDAVFNLDDVAPFCLKEAAECVQEFVEMAGPLLEGLTDEQIGHDFWLTRNHHGAGFWDRGLGKRGLALTILAHSWGELALHVSEDGYIYS